MGFDNECVLNIQSLAGEYFCPVCRLLVYPNEALQSQCTHLYCKQCLTYIVGTTRACPYDGYLVTEADSKPLVESNKTLAETIGKTTVNCLFHRSGCTWQGPLSDSTSHCSGCAFGNSPVVCNRCGVQIVHRQVQEHAQSCPGVQPQAQNSEGAQPATTINVAGAGDQTQAATQIAATTQLVQTSTTSAITGQDSNQQAVTTTQSQPVVPTSVPTAEQWYQHQQQYQQYYQQYPGYDPYQQQYQQYYPYPQPAVAQQQQQLQPQLQAQPLMHSLQHQSQPHHQLPVITPPQNQVQATPQLQTSSIVQPPIQYLTQPQPQVQPQPQAQPQPQSQAQPQPQPQAQPQPPPQPHGHLHAQAHSQNLIQSHAHPQMPQYQHSYAHMQHQQPQVQAHTPSQTQYQNHPVPLPRPSSLAQPQPIPQTFNSQPGQPVNSNLQPQPQQQVANAVTGYQSYPQLQTHQQMPSGVPQHPVQMHPQSGSHPPAQHTIPVPSQFPQQPNALRPPQSNNTMQNPQQPGQVPIVPPAPQQPVHSHAHQPVLPVHQRPVLQPVQQQLHQPHMHSQYPFSGQPWAPGQNQVHQQDPHVQQHQHVQSYMRPQGAHQLSQLPSHPFSQQNVTSPHTLQANQAQNHAGRPIAPLHTTPAQSLAPSAVGTHVRPTMQAGAHQQSGNVIWTGNQAQSSSEKQSGDIPRPERQVDNSVVKGVEAKSSAMAKKELENATAVNTVKSENDVNRMDDVGKFGVEAQDVPESLATEIGKPLLKSVKEEPEKGDGPDSVTDIDNKKEEDPDSQIKNIEDGPKLKTNRLQAEHHEEETLKSEKDKVLHSKSSGAFPQDQVVQQSHSVAAGDISIHHGSSALQQKPTGPPFLQAPHSGALHYTQLPGHPPTEHRTTVPGNIPHPGQPLYPPSEQFQPSMYKQPHGSEIPHGGNLGPGSSSFGRGHSHYGPLPGSYTHPPFQGEQIPSHVHEVDVSTNQRPSNKDGGGSDPFMQHSGMHSNVMRINGTSGSDSSLTSEDRLRPFRDENSNLFPPYPAQHNQVGFEGDLKRFPRPQHLGPEPVPRFGNHFNSSRPLDRGPQGFGMDLAQPLDKGSRGPNYDSGLTMEPLGGSAPARRFFPPFHHDEMMHPSDLVERPMGFHENPVGRLDSSRPRPDFLEPFRGYGRHHMDDFAPRSPGSDYRGMMPHGFVPLPGADDVGGRESRRFGDPISSSFRESRFPALPSHLRRGDIESHGNLQMEEHLRSSDLFAQDGRSNHLRRGEHLGPQSLAGHMRLGEPVGFGAFPSRAGIGEPGPGNFYHQRFGEPGFRSKLSLKGFTSDGGSYAGDFESFDGLRKRKPSKMGWCRICKVDCETVEGLDMHSQTSEHQKMAMDIVATIKRNAKKQKLPPSDHVSIDDTDKSKNSSSEGHGNKLPI